MGADGDLVADGQLAIVKRVQPAPR